MLHLACEVKKVATHCQAVYLTIPSKYGEPNPAEFIRRFNPRKVQAVGLVKRNCSTVSVAWAVIKQCLEAKC